MDAELRGFDESPGGSRFEPAFGWADDHLYSFWAGEHSFDLEVDEYTAPYATVAIHASSRAPAKHRRSTKSPRTDVRPGSQDADVPRISEFYGILIEMFFADHAPPHFHARYAGEEALIEIRTGDVYAGEIPGRALRLVREWLDIHRDELLANWDRAQIPAPLEHIDPLP